MSSDIFKTWYISRKGLSAFDIPESKIEQVIEKIQEGQEVVKLTTSITMLLDQSITISAEGFELNGAILTQLSPLLASHKIDTTGSVPLLIGDGKELEIKYNDNELFFPLDQDEHILFHAEKDAFLATLQEEDEEEVIQAPDWLSPEQYEVATSTLIDLDYRVRLSSNQMKEKFTEQEITPEKIEMILEEVRPKFKDMVLLDFNFLLAQIPEEQRATFVDFLQSDAAKNFVALRKNDEVTQKREEVLASEGAKFGAYVMQNIVSWLS